MYRFDLLDSYSDSVALVTSFRGSSGMVRMYADREDASRQVARAGGGGYDKRGTCLGEFITESFQPELQRIARRAYSQYRRTGEGLKRIESKHPRDLHGEGGRDSLYGMTAYRDNRGRVESVRLDGACGWESICRVAEAIGLQVRYIAETKNSCVHELAGLDKVRDRRGRALFRAIVKASGDAVTATAPDGTLDVSPDDAAHLLASGTLRILETKTGPTLATPDYLTREDVVRAVDRLQVQA